MTSLTKGGNTPWPHARAVLTVTGLPDEGSVLAFLVTETGKVRSDNDFVYFNNPSVPGVAVHGHTATIDPGQIPSDVERVVVAAVQDDADPAPLSARDLQITIDPDRLEVPVSGLSSERAVILVELYRRSSQWKIRNVSAGWTEGFSALVRAHGVEVDDDGGADDPSPVPREPVDPAAGNGPKINLRKPGIDAVDLGQRTGTISLRKGQQVTIGKSALVTATCTWPRDTDYDIFALVRYRDGHSETVSTFGTQDHEKVFQLATTDRAVRHTGDVGRAKGRGWRKPAAQVGKETIEITLGPEILAVVPVVYSAQSNGTGSFRRYQVSMSIDNGDGDTVTIDAGNASDDEAVFSCVPGIIINDPDGVRIQFLELYSEVGSEHRPVIGDDLIVLMDAGPVNAFK